MFANFGRMITAMVTPFAEDGDINYTAAAELTRYLIDSGSTGLVVSGTTGESPVLSREEKLELFRVVVEAAEAKVAVIAGTGGNSTSATVELTEAAEETGVNGIMLVTPYYNKPPQKGLYEHFKAAAAATTLPVMMYNVPGRTGVNMSAETTLKLAEIENIVSVKEASGNLEQAALICKEAPAGFSLYAGDDSLTLPLLSIGATGVVSVASNVAGKKVAEMIGKYLLGDYKSAADLHIDLLPLFKGLFVETNPIPVKAALNLMGFQAGRPRLPLIPLKGEELLRLRKMLQHYGLIG
ncbi:MAG: 4-hydroxy-tetrahydrodipicolinate synthase [Dethiobacter sp.]|nr:4-hydroxy-tetrahydrodipicolinate synthase [Dethiobacter sp.]